MSKLDLEPIKARQRITEAWTFDPDRTAEFMRLGRALAHANQDVMALLAEVERLRNGLERLESKYWRLSRSDLYDEIVDLLGKEANDAPPTKLEDDPEWPYLAVWDKER